MNFELGVPKIELPLSEPSSSSALEISAEKVESAYNRACFLVSKNVRVPGFRAGKIPRQMLEKIVGKDALKFEAFKLLGPELKELIGDRRIKSYTLEIGEPLQIDLE